MIRALLAHVLIICDGTFFPVHPTGVIQILETFKVCFNALFQQFEALKIAKLVYNSNNYGLSTVLITIVTGAYKSTNITGGPLFQDTG